METLYTELYPQFAPKFERLGRNFENDFRIAYKAQVASGQYQSDEELKKGVIKLLKELLKIYTPKRKSGKIIKAVIDFFLNLFSNQDPPFPSGGRAY